jgi:photosystem II stability/assembly factor-like uncharacterized protein
MKRLIFFSLLIIYSNIFAQWHELNSNTKEWLTSVYFINDSTGFTCGNNGLILKTTDFGNTWNKQVTNTKKLLRSIYFIDDNNGIVAGDMGIILRTTNSGTTWNFISDTSHYYALNSICFSDNYNGWVVGGDYIFSSVILKTTNGGQTWNYQASPLGADLASVSAFDKDTIFIIDYTGKLIKSINGGQSWSLVKDFSETLSSVNIMKDNIGYITCSSPYIYKTINKGESWIKQNLNTNEDIYFQSISVYKNKVCLTGGHYGGFYGMILMSADSGKSWKKDSLSERLWDVQLINNDLGYAVGDGGFICKYSTVTDVGKYPSKNILEMDFELSQNYPNPFNPSTTIQFSIPSPLQGEGQRVRSVTLKVYDVLGREVVTLVNETKQPGNYEVKFDGASLPSGVYFYKLNAGDFAQTKKMILLR